jgi:hypothetical protein
MAQRRMMSMHIMDSDAFLDMPPTTQNLYMHMLMRADDDGFVSNPKKIGRMIGANDDDLKILFSKRFVIPFESGVCVIKHWKIHNYIQKDRYQPSKYVEEMASLKVKENGGYTLDTECIQNGDTGKSKVRLGKVKQPSSSSDEGFDLFWISYPRKIGKATALKAWEKLTPPVDEVMLAIKNQKTSDQWTKDNGQFIPHPTSWLNQQRWEDECEYTEKHYTEVFALFESITGRTNPLSWNEDSVQQSHAENLYTEQTLVRVENALRYYKENKEAEYMPLISSPKDLDLKWTKLINHKQKQV